LVAPDKCVLATISVSWGTKLAATLWVADFSAIFPTEFETIDL